MQLLVDGDAADGRKSGGYSLKPGALDRASAGCHFFLQNCMWSSCHRACANADVIIFVSVASGRFAPKQRKGAHEVAAETEGGNFAIDVDDARFSSIFTGVLLTLILASLQFAFSLTFAAQIQITLWTPSIPYSSALLACSRFCKPLSPSVFNPGRSVAEPTLLRLRPLLQGA